MGQNCREKSGETETWQPTKTEKRNGYHKTWRHKGTRTEAIERKAAMAKEKESLS